MPDFQQFADKLHETFKDKVNGLCCITLDELHEAERHARLLATISEWANQDLSDAPLGDWWTFENAREHIRALLGKPEESK